LKRALTIAAARLGMATAANAGELSDLKSQSEQLRQQNEVLTKKIADLERRQRKLESSPAVAPKASRKNPQILLTPWPVLQGRGQEARPG
jgi:cell division protein FtsB